MSRMEIILPMMVKSSFTIGPLPNNKLEFTVVLIRNNGNTIPDGLDSSSKRERKRLKKTGSYKDL